MILIKDITLVLIGFSAGITVAAGVFAFITMIGIIPRLAAKTNTAKNILLYEDIVLIGGTIGNIMIIYKCDIPLKIIGIGLFGLFSGIFTGCLAMSLAEVLNVIPIFMNRLKINKGLSYFIIALAIGKGVGAFYQLYLNYKLIGR